MKIKTIISGIKDENKDPQERMFILVAVVAMAALAIITLVGLFLGESWKDLLTLAGAFVVFAVFFVLAFSLNKVQLLPK